MNQPHELIIFTRKEMLVVVTLCVTLGAFAFTYGVHLGKRVGGPMMRGDAEAVSRVAGIGDRLPSNEEFSAETTPVESHIDQVLTDELHGEVEKTGIRLKHSHQVTLPESTQDPKGGATELSRLVKPEDQKYTLQVGSYPTLDEATRAIQVFKDIDLDPFLREVKVSGKGKWFRIYLGKYRSVKDAEMAGQKYKAKKTVPAYVVSKL